MSLKTWTWPEANRSTGTERVHPKLNSPAVPADLLTLHMSRDSVHVESVQECRHAGPEKLDLLQGTLDLMVLRTLATLGSLHGYGSRGGSSR